jgi:carbamoyl-phosphate synthase large subunit
MRPHILITSPGPDGQLLKAFARELYSLFPGGKVLTADARPDRPAYACRLLEMCISNAVGLVVPTAGSEVAWLARYRRDFTEAGVTIAVSDPRFVDMTRDKRTMMAWFRQRGLETARSINSRAEARFPIVAIPNDGHGSQKPMIVADAAQFASLLLHDPELIFTECLPREDFEEYTVDMYYSADGALHLALPRQQGDDNVAGRTATHPAIASLRERFDRVPGARGCVTMQACVDRRTAAVYGIDVKAHVDDGRPQGSVGNFARLLIQDYLPGKPDEATRRQAA